jgi:hypothetical protein
VLERLVWRLCAEHPHHSLLQLMALANGAAIHFGDSPKYGRANVDPTKVCA